MGVPISFLDKYNPDQFDILGMDFYVKAGLLADLIAQGWQGKLVRQARFTNITKHKPFQMRLANTRKR